MFLYCQAVNMGQENSHEKNGLFSGYKPIPLFPQAHSLVIECVVLGTHSKRLPYLVHFVTNAVAIDVSCS